MAMTAIFSGGLQPAANSGRKKLAPTEPGTVAQLIAYERVDGGC